MFSEGSSDCMADCISLLTPHPPSLYEQYCCLSSNSGKKFRLKENNRVKFILCPPSVPTSCIKHTFLYNSCIALLQAFPTATSGYYSLTLSNGSIVNVYCDMEGSNCDGKGGWMRVGYLNMSQPGATCPPGLNTYNFSGINYPLCDRLHNNENGCSSALFSPLNISYQHVCGNIRGYQYRVTDGIYPNYGGGVNSLDGPYVDGISITTHGTTRQHLWTYICGNAENKDNYQSCPCNTGSSATVSSFVGNNYYCESGADDGYSSFPNAIFTDVLWDGQNCNFKEHPCCNNPKMPWFVRTLNQSTTDDIELRLCTSEGYPDEAVPVDFFEFYVR